MIWAYYFGVCRTESPLSALLKGGIYNFKVNLFFLSIIDYLFPIIYYLLLTMNYGL